MVAAGAASSAEPERMNSALARLNTPERNSLGMERLGQLGLLRIIMRGQHSRKPRYHRAPKAGATGDPPGASNVDDGVDYAVVGQALVGAVPTHDIVQLGGLTGTWLSVDGEMELELGGGTV